MLAQKSSDPKTTPSWWRPAFGPRSRSASHTAFKRKRKWRAVQSVCMCVCVLWHSIKSPSQTTLIFHKTPLIAVHASVLYNAFRNGTISDIKKDTHTHTQLMARLSPWMGKSRNLWRPSKAVTNPRTRTSERQSGMWYDRVRHGADGIFWMLLFSSKLISLLAVTLQYFPVLALGFCLASTTEGLGEGERKIIKRKKELHIL